VKILVTGANGFSGKHLLDLLCRQTKGTLVALYRRRRLTGYPKRVVWKKVDLRQKAQVMRLCNHTRPQQVYHLAAYVKGKNGFSGPEGIYRNNVLGTFNILEAIRRFSPGAKILNVGSSYEYGKVPEAHMPIRETERLNPNSIYGASKLGQEAVMRYYGHVYGLRIVCTRTFYYAGPGQPRGFLFANLVQEFNARTSGTKSGLKIVNPDDRFDYTDIRDVARAYYLLMQKGRCGEVYNVASGKTRTLRDITECMADYCGGNIRFVFKKKKHGPLDHRVYVGYSSKIKKHTGWKPHYRIGQTIRDMFDQSRGFS